MHPAASQLLAQVDTAVAEERDAVIQMARISMAQAAENVDGAKLWHSAGKHSQFIADIAQSESRWSSTLTTLSDSNSISI